MSVAAQAAAGLHASGLGSHNLRPPRLVLHDTFTDNDGTGIDSHTPDFDASGEGYIYHSYRHYIYGNGVVNDHSRNNTFAGVKCGQDVWMQASLTGLRGGSNDEWGGLSFRGNDDALEDGAILFLPYGADGTTDWMLRYWDNPNLGYGGATIKNDFSGPAANVGQTYTVELSMVGQTFNAWVDGTLLTGCPYTVPILPTAFGTRCGSSADDINGSHADYVFLDDLRVWTW